MPYKPLGGTSRRYVDTETGETISRREYEKRRREERLQEIESRLQERFAEFVIDTREFSEHGWDWTRINIDSPQQEGRAGDRAEEIIRRIPDGNRVLVRIFGVWDQLYGPEESRWITKWGGAVDSQVAKNQSLSWPGKAEIILIGHQRRK